MSMATASNGDFLSLIYFLHSLRYFLERLILEVYTDNQVLKTFSKNSKPNRWEDRWLEALCSFRIFKTTLEPGSIHVFRDIFLRAPLAYVNGLEPAKIDLDEMDCAY